MIQKRKQIIFFSAIIIVCMVGMIMGLYQSPQKRMARLLDLGQEYLEDGKYEQAFAVFDEVLDIEAKNKQAYQGMEDTATKWGYLLVEDGEYDDAIAVVKKGYQRTKSKRLKNLKKKFKREEKVVKMREEMLLFCEDLVAYYATDDYESISDMLNTEEYENVNNGLWDLDMEENGNIIIDVDDCRVGFYRIRGYTHMIFCGDYAGDERSERGIWLKHGDDANSYAVGDWKNDRPNGRQEIHIDHFQKDPPEPGTWRYMEESGNVVDGLWNGDVVEISQGNDMTLHAYSVKYDHGYEVWLDDYGLLARRPLYGKGGALYSTQHSPYENAEGIFGYDEGI